MKGLLRGIAGVGAAALLAALTVPAQAVAVAGATSDRPAMPATSAIAGADRPQTVSPAAASPRAQARLAPLRLAQRQAAATGHPVTVAAATTQTSMTVARPDGTFVTTTSVLPVRVRQGGGWVPVSATLRRVGTGYEPAATPSGLIISAGAQGPLAVMTSPSGGRLAFSLPFPLPRPSVSGATATYRGVLPGVDLVVTANDQGGFNEVLVVRDATAAANPALRRLRLAMSARGLRVRTDAHGNLTATAPDGAVEFSAPPSQMWDSGNSVSGVSGPGPRAHVAAVGMQAAAGALVLIPDQRMLSSRSTEWPLFIDPSVNPTSSGTVGYAETQQGCPTYENFNSSSVTTEGIGYQDYSDACQGLYRSFYQLKTTNLNSSMVISSSKLLLQEVYGADEDCSDTWPVTLKWTAGIGAATAWSLQPAVQSTIATASPKSAWCGAQDVDFNVTSVMQTTAAHNYTQWTFGLYGDESILGHSSCSPSPDYNCGFMRFADNPTVATTFDIAPDVPTSTTTTPAAQNGETAIPDSGCDGGPVGWIGQSAAGAGNGSNVTLNATVTSNIEGENVRAQYTLWDNSATSGAADTDVVASPDSGYVSSGTPVDTPVGLALKDGHAYAWTADAYDGILTSADAPDCSFDVDLTPPTVPVVSSAAFPPSGSVTASPPAVGATGTFSLASTDPVPAGCASTCLASGVSRYEYSFNTALPTVGATTAQPGQAVSFTAARWGTNILYVAAVDNAGNVSQVAQYDFYVEFTPGTKITPGDVNGDGIPDLLATDTTGDLLLYPGNSDPAVTPVQAGTPATSPDGTDWNTYQIAHRGSMSSGGTVDDLFLHKGANLWLYRNNPDEPGGAPQFDDKSSVVPITPKPSCAATASNAANCTGYDAADWSDVTQILAPGDVYAASPAEDDGLPDLLTVENDQLWLYEGEPGYYVDTPVLLGSSGWSGMTLIAPGEVDGQLTLWARDNSSGTIYSWPLALDSSGVPELGTATAGAPVTASSGTIISGVTLTAAAYPVVASTGALTSGTCAAADPTACPGLYAEDTSGNLWYYLGESAVGGASPLAAASSPILVGTIDRPDHQWKLADGSGTTAADSVSGGAAGTLTGTSWLTDATRGTVVSFNGSSSSLQLPGDLVENTTTQSWSLWFKTSAAGRVLLSTGDSAIGASSPNADAIPVLYIGTNGDLYGQFWTGQVNPMHSTTAINDGKWHHVVITADVGTQTLYLDGTEVGAVGGTIDNLGPLDFVGAGYVNADGWVNGPAVGWSYFAGEVSDIEYYAYPMAPSEVAATSGGQGPIGSGPA